MHKAASSAWHAAKRLAAAVAFAATCAALALALGCGGCATSAEGDMRGFAPDPFSIPLGAEERIEQ